MEHNHPKLRDWARLSLTEALALAEKTPFNDEEADLVAADIAIQGIRVREKVKKVLIITDGLTREEIEILGFAKSETLQGALDEVLEQVPNGRVGVLPRGGDCLPYLA